MLILEKNLVHLRKSLNLVLKDIILRQSELHRFIRPQVLFRLMLQRHLQFKRIFMVILAIIPEKLHSFLNFLVLGVVLQLLGLVNMGRRWLHQNPFQHLHVFHLDFAVL